MKYEDIKEPKISRIYSIVVALCVTTPVLALVVIKILLTSM
ncbi:hypothetical protein [Clostridium frigoris]|nr:hypothetical protein [Clostridium frigoris]